MVIPPLEFINIEKRFIDFVISLWLYNDTYVDILFPDLFKSFQTLPACLAISFTIFHPSGPFQPPPFGNLILNFFKSTFVLSFVFNLLGKRIATLWEDGRVRGK